MKSVLRLITPAAILTAITLTPLGKITAQSSNSYTLNIAAGAAFPTGDFAQFSDVGYNLTVGIGTNPRNSQLGFRLEGMYNEFGISGVNGKSHAGGVTGNATYDLMSGPNATSGLNFYLIGGIGYFSTKEPVFFNSNSDSNIGYNIGAGLRFPLTGFSAYVEGRYHSISNTDVHFVPLVFGLVF